ncbi:hypothetical protein K488DRAFT_89829 [Vararia minispora EC-137]|uniref:Uncharacterized protein n=1 Tax=Vararia minispora EC-137 TaxID=1314806 RepID=A0ACB8Q992_9AGAM|nr:hypothetical protein K488DRAFT_89829 [Vararia minispora EC-137]
MASKLTLSSAESTLVDQIFKRNDPQNFGVVTGDVAVSVFSGSGLPTTTLGEIWNVADSDNKGFLDRNGVAAAIRLIGHAQAGKTVSDALLSQPGPPPSISGYSQHPPARTARSPPPKPPTAAGLPPLTPADKAKFLRIFQGCGPVNGLLSGQPSPRVFLNMSTDLASAGDKARDVFVKSKLPVDKLSQIWSLADTKSRGTLDATDFTIAMYMIQALMGGALSFVPTTLPPGLYEQASGDAAPLAVAVHATGGSGTYSPGVAGAFPGRAIQPQYTGSSLQPQATGTRPAPPAVPPRAQSAFIPAFPAPSTMPWDVTPAEKASADKFFDTLDTQKRGYIEGDVAVPFLLQSNLPEDVLAQVWDLADLHNDGRLTREGFAIAMHLIQGKLAGKDIPAALPASLIPPNLRSTIAPAPVSTPSQPLAPVNELSDLLWDDEPVPEKPKQAPLQPQSTGAFSSTPLQPQHTSASLQPQQTAGSPFASPPVQPQTTGTGAFQGATVQPQLTGAFKSPALQPQSTGLRGVTQAQPPAFASPFTTQTPVQASPGDPFGAPVRNNLLDDDEPTAASSPLQDRSAEIGNAQNQLHSTNRSLEITKNERADVEARIAEQASQLAALQTQLATAKVSYETETRLLAQLRERFSNQTAEIATTRTELIRAESDLSAARVEKAEVEQGVLRDKEEIRELQRKMAEAGGAVEVVKAEVEKARKEAKQQKGLLAIAKKQLATREAEKAKASAELLEARAEAQAATREREQADAELAKVGAISAPVPVPVLAGNGITRTASPSADSVSFAAAHPLPPGTPSSIGSPTGKSTNPFDRLVNQPTGGSIRAQSPFLPFANASLPSSPPVVEPVPTMLFGETTPTAPSTEPASTEEPAPSAKPFDFEQTSTPTPAPVAAANGEAGQRELFEPEFPVAQEVLSPTSDGEMFSTPPTKPSDGSRISTVDTDLGTSLFTTLDAAASPVAEESHNTKPDTDLGAQLMELQADEDTSSDEEDNQPLALHAAAKAIVDAPIQTAALPPEVQNAEAPTTDALAVTPSISFDDAFGGGSPFEPTGAPTLGTSPFEQALNPPPSSSKDAFDESFRDRAPPAASGSGFTFDDAFEDNFDFGSASAAAPVERVAAVPMSSTTGGGFFPPPPNGTARHSILPPQAADSAFESAFTPPAAPTVAVPSAPERSDSNPFTPGNAPSPWVPSVSPTVAPVHGPPAPAPVHSTLAPTQDHPPSAAGTDLGISFDEAFGGVNSSQALALDGGFNSVSSRASAAPSHAPFSTTAAATSSPTRNGRRTSLSSPPRESTPPPRVSSPRPRPSTASGGSKDGPDKHDKHDKDKGREPKRSGLSIRLPFGKKKKTQDALPPPVHPSSLLPVPSEEPSSTPLAAGQDDDIETVKQLCGMGFSRTQAVTALEANGYDLQQALNSLVGTA